MSSIWASLSGIRAHQFMLDVIGTNLANANSTGYKSSRVTFAETMSQTIRPASSGTTNTGGTNPIQLGLGVEVGAVVRDFSQGSLEETGNPLDLAMLGRGFMVLSDSTNRNVYSRSSSFSVDANNYLVDATNGFHVLDITNSAIEIPYNVQIPGNKTLNINMSGNLSASAETPQAEVFTTIAAIEAGSAAATAATTLNALDTNSTDYVDGDTITVSGTKTDGTALSATFTYGAANDGTTVGDLMTAINTLWSGDATLTIDASGNLLLTADATGAATLSITLADGSSNTGATNWATHSFYVTTDGSDGDSRTAATTIYDSRGESHILTLTFSRSSEREWNMSAALGDTDGTLTKSTITGIRFNTNGSFNSISGGGSTANQLTIDFGTIAEAQTLVMDFGTSAQFDGLTLFGGNSTAAVTSQDGYAAGTLTSFNITSDGSIEGTYTNNQLQNLGQILVATFDNPEGLESVGHGMWGSTVNSGDAVLGTALSGRAGKIASAVLEASNVESATELTKLLIAQHGYQLSTRTMAVSNRIIQELTNII